MKIGAEGAVRSVTLKATALFAVICALSPLKTISPAEAQNVQTSCRPGKYPDDGNFEVAEIIEQTPAIINLQKKRVDQHQSYADVGTIVVVWGTSGRHACVHSPTGTPEIDFWIDQKSLEAGEQFYCSAQVLDSE